MRGERAKKVKRTQFVIGGTHPLLLLVRDYLIQQGYALVDTAGIDFSMPAFLVWGGRTLPLTKPTQLPTLLLSSSCVYSDRDHLLQQREIEPMDEAHGHVITSPLDPSVIEPLSYLMSEHSFVQRPEGKTIVVRPFGVYGPNVGAGVVNAFAEALALDEPLKVHAPGRQVRTFLYEEDFLECIGILVKKLLRGSRGIYNVGSDEQIEILSLAKSLGHAFNKAPQIEFVETPRRVWWRVPALDRIRADARWRAKVSLRNGLFRMVRDVDFCT